MPSRPRAVLVERLEWGQESRIDELKELAESAGYDVVGSFRQVRHEDPRYHIGEGKVKELAEFVRENDVDKVIFENEIKPVQAFNLAGELGVEVIDRFQLILEIFAQRARTREAKLQVKLAQLKYELPRAREMVNLAKKEERPGFRGLGKYEADKYEEMIRRKIAKIEHELRRIEKDRELKRKHRHRLGFELVTLAGYTCAGKSTLMRTLTDEAVYVDSKIFSTLDTKTRAVDLDGHRVLLTDTVGFVDNLPHWLMESFKSTLEETAQADLILLVVDVSDELPEIKRKLRVCHRTLDEIGAEGPIVTALNKADLIGWEEAERRLRELEGYVSHPVAVSAKTGEGLDDLKAEMRKVLSRYWKNVRIELPMRNETMRVVSKLHELGNVLDERWSNDGVEVFLEVSEKALGTVRGTVKGFGKVEILD
ncbi:GTPase HflX [Methanopyrus sp.]